MVAEMLNFPRKEERKKNGRGEEKKERKKERKGGSKGRGKKEGDKGKGTEWGCFFWEMRRKCVKSYEAT